MKTTGCMNKQYLISNQTALQLYEYAGALPIIDYHNHLSVADIQSDRRFTDIYTLWIEPDPYKHRAMRMCGVEEKYITGDAEPIEKFTKWCETLPKLPGNPLYIWSVMELEQVFGLSVDLHSLDPEELYTQCNSYLAQNSVTACGLLDLSSDLPLGDIAKRSGFKSSAAMRSAFAARYNMTPTEYRRRKRQ